MIETISRPTSKRRTPSDLADMLYLLKCARQADDVHRRRGIRNVMFYLGLHYGQWTDELKAALSREGRDPNTYNFAQIIVKGHVGNWLMNAIDPKFIDADGDGIDVTNALNKLQKIYYSEKDRYCYKASSLQAFENGLCYRGCEELVIDKPSSDPRSHSLKFEPVRHDLLIFDPNNRTDRISRNSKKAWKMSYLNKEEMCNVFYDKEDEITRAFAESSEDPYNNPIRLNDYDNLDDMIKPGGRRLAVEFFHIEHEYIKKQFFNGVEVPDSGFGIGTIDDITFKMQWAVDQGFELTDEGLITVRDRVPRLYLTTFVPSLGLTLADDLDERQLGEHLPLYAWSYVEKWGLSKGIIDDLIDPCADINKREMAKTKAITQSMINGKPWISEDITPEGGDKEYDEIVQDFNDSSKPIKTPGGVPGNTLFGIVQGGQVNAALYTGTNEKIEFVNRIGSLPPAMQGFQGGNPSGIAIGRQVIEGSIMQRLHTETFITYEHDKNEDWLILAPKIFGGRHNANRKFKGKDGVETIANELVGFEDSGREIILDDLSKLKRIHVIIAESKENDYMKQAQREMDVAALTAITPTPQSDVIRAAFECSLAQRMDFTDDIEKEAVKTACEKRQKLANATADLQILQSISMGMQIQQQMAMQAAGAIPNAQPPVAGNPAATGSAPPGPVQPSNQDTMNSVRTDVPPVERAQ